MRKPIGRISKFQVLVLCARGFINKVTAIIMSIMMCYTSSSWYRDGMWVKCSLTYCMSRNLVSSTTSVPFSFQLIPEDFNPCAYLCTAGHFSTTSSSVFGFQSWTALCDYVCWDPCGITLLSDTVFQSHFVFQLLYKHDISQEGFCPDSLRYV